MNPFIPRKQAALLSHCSFLLGCSAGSLGIGGIIVGLFVNPWGGLLVIVAFACAIGMDWIENRILWEGKNHDS